MYIVLSLSLHIWCPRTSTNAPPAVQKLLLHLSIIHFQHHLLHTLTKSCGVYQFRLKTKVSIYENFQVFFLIDQEALRFYHLWKS